MGLVETLNKMRIVEKGYRTYKQTGQTPDYAYHAMRDLYRLTGGWSHDYLTSQICKSAAPLALPENPTGIASEATKSAEILSELKANGFAVLKQRLSPQAVKNITEFALLAPCRPIPKRPDLPESTTYERSSPRAELYKFDEDVLIQQPDLQSLLADLSMAAMSQNYLGAPPTLSHLEMWWTTGYSKVASNQAAQLYHYDLDWGSRWLKFFVYLNDVGSDNGPHCYVRGSHVRTPKTKKLISLGDRRLTDDEVLSVYPESDVVEITGASGTIVAVDTRGFHKGKPIVSGERLIIQLEYATSLFGTNPRPKAVGQDTVEPLKVAKEKYPTLYTKYL